MQNTTFALALNTEHYMAYLSYILTNHGYWTGVNAESEREEARQLQYLIMIYNSTYRYPRFSSGVYSA